MKNPKMLKILLTPGDAAGIGPEVALKAAESEDRKQKTEDGRQKTEDGKRKTDSPSSVLCPLSSIPHPPSSVLCFIGPKWLWKQTAEHFSLPLPENILEVPVLKNIPETKINFGKVSGIWGEIAMESVKFAAETCLKKEADAMVTAPLTKAGIHLASYKYQGHTDFLAEITNTKKHAMMLSSKKLRVLMVTHHQSLKSVSDSLSIENIFEKIELANFAGKKLGINYPKIAVCGLNPHSGEAGAFGTEEIKFSCKRRV